MISQFVINFATAFGTWVTTLFPSWSVPSWFTGLDGTLNGISAKLSGIGAWVPWGLCFTILAVCLATWVVCIGIKLVLKVAAFLPFVGGSG